MTNSGERRAQPGLPAWERYAPGDLQAYILAVDIGLLTRWLLVGWLWYEEMVQGAKGLGASVVCVVMRGVIIVGTIRVRM